jgi:ketosteroid isomerase-like protein
MSGAFLASYVVLWVAVVVLSVAVFALYHHFGQLYLKSADGRVDQGPKAGKTIRPLEAETTRGRLNVPDGTATVMAFMETDCVLCADLRHSLRTFAEENQDVRVIAVVGGERDAIRNFATSLGDRVAVVHDVGGKITRRYGIAVFPFAVAIDASGIVRMKDIVNERNAVERLAHAALAAAELGEEVRV